MSPGWFMQGHEVSQEELNFSVAHIRLEAGRQAIRFGELNDPRGQGIPGENEAFPIPS
jgi:hypothetical protein